MRMRLPRIADRTVADAVRLVGRLLDDVGSAGLQPLEGAIEVGGGQDDAGVGALGHHLIDRAALVIADVGVGSRRLQNDGRVGLVDGTDRDPPHATVSDVVADLETEGVTIESERCVWVAMREETPVNG